MLSINRTLIALWALLLLATFPPSSAHTQRRGLVDEVLFEDVAAGRCDLIESALATGKDPNICSNRWGSLLKYACATGQWKIVTLLLSYGADPSRKGNEGILFRPIMDHKLDIIRALVGAGAPVRKQEDDDYDFDYLVVATTNGTRETVEFLLHHGADPNGSERVCNETALLMAASRGDLDVVRLLLSAGANINHRDCNGWSALMHACNQGQQAVAEYLVKKGANARFQDDLKRDAAYFAGHLDGNNAEAMKIICSGE